MKSLEFFNICYVTLRKNKIIVKSINKNMSVEYKYSQLKNSKAYCTAFNLSNCIWQEVVKWDYFSQRTIGQQLVRAVDSVSANIAEGYGRYHKKDKIKFYYYARGSASESCDFCLKAKIRGLLSEKQYQIIFNELQKLPQEINGLISHTHNKLKE